MLTVFGVCGVYKLLEKTEMHHRFLLRLSPPDLSLFDNGDIILGIWFLRLVTGSQLVEGLGDLMVGFGAKLYLEVVEDTGFHVFLGAEGFLQEAAFFEVLSIEEIHLFFLF